jgi:hypothetical protein
MKLSDIFESPQQDILYRNEAKRMLDNVINEVKRNGFSNFKFHNAMKAYYKKFDDLTLVFIKGRDGDGGVSPKSKTMTLELSDFSESGITHKVKIAFIHEYIHLLDSVRFNKMNPAPNPDFYGMSAYENHPTELNAHYQEALSQLDDVVVRYGTRITSKWSSPELFMKSALSLFKPGFIDRLNDRNRKAVLRRLYKHYSDVLRKGV